MFNLKSKRSVFFALDLDISRKANKKVLKNIKKLTSYSYPHLSSFNSVTCVKWKLSVIIISCAKAMLATIAAASSNISGCPSIFSSSMAVWLELLLVCLFRIRWLSLCHFCLPRFIWRILVYKFKRMRHISTLHKTLSVKFTRKPRISRIKAQLTLTVKVIKDGLVWTLVNKATCPPHQHRKSWKTCIKINCY